MRIGIDARFVGTPGGIGRYVEELVRAISEIASVDTFVLFVRDRDSGLGTRDLGRVRLVDANVRWYTIAEQIRMPRVIDRERLDLMHYPHWNVPVLARTPFVLTVHDLILFDHPSRCATMLDPLRYAIKSLSHRFVLGEAVRRARRIIAPSEYTKGRIVERLGCDPARIVVIPEGVGLGKGEEKGEEKGSPKILYVGNAYPHKNLEGLLEAFRLVRREMPEAELTIAGHGDYFFKRLRALARDRGFGHEVRFVGSPSDEVLEDLYAASTLFVIPSFVEGFGLTPLEAMARGLPVAASGGGALPEVLGDAALFFDPRDHKEMAATICGLLTDERARAERISRGRRQAARYSWREAAARTLEVYRAAAHQPDW